jgi:hypothetical protein
MHTVRRTLFRSSTRTSIGAAALLLTVGAVAAACSGGGDKSPGGYGQELTGGDQCSGVQLDASTFYKPRSWADATVNFAAGTLTFAVPSTLTVTGGRSGNGKAKFVFRNGSETPTVCSYRGNGTDQYTFLYCHIEEYVSPDQDDNDYDLPDTSAPGPAAGATVTADHFFLHVNKGDKNYGTTSVSLHLGGPTVDDGNACTIDACNAESGVSHTPVNTDDGDGCTTDTCDPGSGVSHTLVDTPFCRGRAAFNDGTLEGQHGNGRACSTCHIEADQFRLKPATAEARWQALQAARATNPLADDPLFRPIDADDFRTNGANATSFKNLRHGLIRITFPLPSNVRLVGPDGNVTNETFVDVWRAVPSIEHNALTGPDGQLPAWPPPVPTGQYQRLPGQEGPNLRGGFQLDARFGSLQEQAQGALTGHAETTSPAPLGFLADLAAFQSTIFAPAEPPLTDFEQQGKVVFERSCGQCHGGPGMSTPILQVPEITRYSSINLFCPRVVDSPTWCVASGGTAPCPPRFQHKACPSADEVPGLQPRTYQITHPDTGWVFRRTSSDPGRFLLTGYTGGVAAPAGCTPGSNINCAPLADRAGLQDFNVFDPPGLHGISRRAPYFHDNTALTLEEVLDFYDAFFTGFKINLPSAPVLTTGPGMGPNRPFTPQERPALLAFLKRL